MAIESTRTDSTSDASSSDPSAASQAFDHVRMLWEDQVELASTLRTRRRTLLTVLAIVTGVGVLRVDLRGDPLEPMAVPAWAVRGVAVMVCMACLCFFLTAYFLCTQRPIVRRLWHWIGQYLMRLWRMARAKSVEEARQAEEMPATAHRWPTGRALATVLDDDEDLQDWISLAPPDALLQRALRLRAAYRTLCDQNRRISDRLKLGVLTLLAAFLLAIGAIVLFWMTLAFAQPGAP